MGWVLSNPIPGLGCHLLLPLRNFIPMCLCVLSHFHHTQVSPLKKSFFVKSKVFFQVLPCLILSVSSSSSLKLCLLTPSLFLPSTYSSYCSIQASFPISPQKQLWWKVLVREPHRHPSGSTTADPSCTPHCRVLPTFFSIQSLSVGIHLGSVMPRSPPFFFACVYILIHPHDFKDHLYVMTPEYTL